MAHHKPGTLTLPELRQRTVINIREAAMVLRMSEASTYHACRTGEIPAVFVSNRWLVSVPGLLRLLQADENGHDSSADLDSLAAEVEQVMAPPPPSPTATAAEKALDRFIEERCVLDAERWVRAADVWNTYSDWIEETESPALHRAGFSQGLQARGFERVVREEGRRYHGITLRDQP